MENLLQLIQNNDGQKAVSARDLYFKLGYEKSQYSRWHKKNILENPFAIENKDYQRFDIQVEGNNTIDFALDMEFAMKLCMVSKTKEGEKYRDYLIEVVKELRNIKNTTPPPTQIQIPQTFAEALKLAYEQQITIERLETRTKFVDVVFNSDDLLTGSQVCKLLNLSYGNKTLYKNLREKGIFFKNRNEPKQLFVDKGYFRMKEILINDKVKIQTYFTQKGLGYIAKYLNVILQPISTIKMISN